VSGVEQRKIGPLLVIPTLTVDSVDTVSSSSDDNSTTPLIGSDFMITDILNHKFSILK